MSRTSNRAWPALINLALTAALLGLLNDRTTGEDLPPPRAPAPATTIRQAAIETAEKLLAEGDYAGAKAAYETALSLGDRSATVYGGRAAARIGLDDIDDGIADLKEAIARNPGDLGQKYKPSSSVTFSKAALDHGEAQVRKMLKDRPAMAEHVKPGDALWQWAARKFAGEDLDDTIDWDPTPPREADSGHEAATEARRGSIRVSPFADGGWQPGDPARADTCWRRAIFELHYVKFSAEERKVEDDVWDERTTELGFTRRMREIERKALQETRAFYAHVYLPWVKGSAFKTHADEWRALAWDGLAEFIRRYELGAYPRDSYADRHFLLQLARNNARKAIELGEECSKMGPKAAVAAEAAFRAAMRIRAHGVSAYGFRAAARIGLGDFDGGIADLNEAIRLHPGDAGHDYVFRKANSLKAEALAHGEKQVRQMLKDRPAMAEHVKPGDAIWKWAVRKFAGEDLDDTIDWDAEPPREASAEHSVPTELRRGSIRISEYAAYDEQAGPKATFDELWNRAAFEIHNITHHKEFLEVHADAWYGKLTEEEYVARTCAIEAKASQEMRAFYAEVYLPWAKTNGVKTLPSRWDVLWWGRAENLIQRYTDRESYPWRPYVRHYLSLQTVRLLAERKHAEALKLAERYLAAARFPEEKADAQLCQAEAWIGLGDLPHARQAFEAALKVAPAGYNSGRLAAVTAQLYLKWHAEGDDWQVSPLRSGERHQTPEPGTFDLVELFKDKA